MSSRISLRSVPSARVHEASAQTIECRRERAHQEATLAAPDRRRAYLNVNPRRTTTGLPPCWRLHIQWASAASR
jgi:hypothetical protein